LREAGRAKIDEGAIFKAVEQMRAITDNAIRRSRAARRNHLRRSHLRVTVTPALPALDIDTDQSSAEVARPFDDIEEWL
jgi:hypothetical protein